MGFYGNITNTSKTQFQFDRTYSSRSAMENKMYTDNVYAGRYVLVEYDSTPELGAFSRVYFFSGIAYTSPNHEVGTGITKNDVDYGDIRFTADNVTPTNQLVYKNCTFYVCTSEKIEGSTEWATWERVVNSTDPYVTNYNIDIAAYGSGRGYDSTVWQKAYIDGSEKYIQIAELNSVVPTFDIAADAPTMSPITPHFDVNSTNVYYKLHVQPQWGLRVKEGQNENPKTVSSDTTIYPSDEISSYKKVTYDPVKGTENITTVSYPSAIYYNKAGFDKNIRTYDETLEGQDVIQIEPTGYSGNKYNTHTKSDVTQEAIDIQELRIILPSLGNTISDLWDLAFGQIRNQDIAWNSTEGLRLSPKLEGADAGYAYNPGEEISTIAGCINSIHDLMGMIIVDDIQNATDADDEHIYYDAGRYSQKWYSYLYEPISANDFDKSQTYYNNATNEYGAIGSIWNNELGCVEGVTSTRSKYAYFKELKGFAKSLNTIHGLILKINKILESGDIYTRDPNTVQGCINKLNDIFDKFDALIPKNFLTVGNDGQIHSTNWTTAQAFEAIGEESAHVEDAKENRWIYFDLDADNHKFTIEHRFNKVENTTSETNLNNGNDMVQLYTPIVDNMGHIVGNNIETITLPYGYKVIKVNNTEDTAVNFPDVLINDNGQIANNTQDTLIFNASNRWIKFDNNTEDTIKVGHKLSNFESGSANTLYGQAKDMSIAELDINNQFTIPILRFDEAGHIDFAEQHTITLPENFTTVNIANSGLNAVTIPNNVDGNLTADILTDTVKLDSGNRWIKLVADDANNKVSFVHAAAGVAPIANTTQTGDETPAFGSTFLIPEIKYDETGHIANVSTHTVKIPLPSLNAVLSEDNASVITGLSFIDTTGTLSQTNKKVGTLLLTDYIANTDSTDISASDSINKAFGKLQYQINQEETNRINAINGLNEKLNAEQQERQKSDDNLNLAIQDLEKNIANTYQTILIAGEDYVIPSTLNNYQTKLTAGKDYVIPDTLNNYLKSDVTFTYQDSIQTLQDIITSIDNRLSALENPITEPKQPTT